MIDCWAGLELGVRVRGLLWTRMWLAYYEEHALERLPYVWEDHEE